MKSLEPRRSILVQEELADLRNVIDGMPDEFKTSLFINPYVARLNHLKDELYYSLLLEEAETAEGNLVDMRLNSFEGALNSLKISVVSDFLRNTQDLFTNLGKRALELGVAARQAVCQLNPFNVEVMAFSAGSFAVRFKIVDQGNQPCLDIPEDNTSHPILKQYDDLLNINTETTSLQDLEQQYGVDVVLSYKKYIAFLNDNNLSLTSGLISKDKQYISAVSSLVQGDIEALTTFTSSYSPSTTTVVRRGEYTGRLIKANMNNSKFTIESNGQKRAFSLPARLRNIIIGLEIGTTYRVVFSESEVQTAGTNIAVSKYHAEEIHTV